MNRFMQAGILAAVLTAGLVLTAGCADPEEMIEGTVQRLIEEENAAIAASADRDQEAHDNALAQAETGREYEEWPSEVPAWVPPLPGDITQVMTMNPDEITTNHTIAYENITGITADEYHRQLTEAGWNIDMTMEMNGEWFIQASMNDEASIVITVSDDNTGVVSLTLL